MTLAFDFHPEARAESFADVDWYDDREFGIGASFEVAVREAIDAAVDSPESWAFWPIWDREPTVRSKGVHGFPYRVVYFVAGEELAIAVAHTKRRPVRSGQPVTPPCVASTWPESQRQPSGMGGAGGSRWPCCRVR